ncbi:hypothetical protein [Actinomadura sp. CNU-125]|uniref:hypothetical protein n=1 Tax=Actinomadura sp. CNU-125 TaxID=1904961 RepID=UPI001177D9A0|nr:hypothetical protein [Actinomadura sp. CNU-125]
MNPEPQVREPAEPANPEPANREPEVQNHPAEPANPEPEPLPEPRTTRTTNLGDRAKKKAEEIEQVADLIRERGEKAVTLGVVRKQFGFTKTTGYHRLVAARELVNQEPVAS